MKLKVLMGSGDRILLSTLPFAAAAVILNVLRPAWFTLGLGVTGLVIGIILLAVGAPVWLGSVALVLIRVPQKRLITTGPFAVVCHPMYAAVSLLVLPGLGFLLDTWSVIALGGILYILARVFSPAEERILASVFPEEYAAYRRRVLLPWL
jgi:protein-S-isoprenylcysteine O-methyltransferase Ste14